MSGAITFFPNKDTFKSETFFASGSFTVPKGINHMLIMGCGGGGGGQSGNSSDSYSYAGLGGAGVIPIPIWVMVTPGDVINFSIGTGGTGGAPRSDRFFNNGTNGGNTLVTLAGGNTITFKGGQGGGQGGSTGVISEPYRSQIGGGARVNDSNGKNVDTTNGESSHYASGGIKGIRIAATDEPYDAGGAGGGAGYEQGGNGGNGGDTSTPSGAGTDGGISAGGGGGGSNGNGVDGGSGPFPSGAGGNGGPGLLIIQWSEHQ